MKTGQTITLPSDVAMALKEIIISTMPKKIYILSPMEIVMWIKVRQIAKKIHMQLFASPREIAFTLSVTEELALYNFLLEDKEGAIVSLDPILLNFLKTVDQKIKTNIFIGV